MAGVMLKALFCLMFLMNVCQAISAARLRPRHYLRWRSDSLRSNVCSGDAVSCGTKSEDFEVRLVCGWRAGQG